MVRAIPVLSLLLVLPCVSPRHATAGEFECFLGCRIDSFSNIKWKPSSSCYKPSAPSFYGSTAAEYNMAVDSFNRWLGQMRQYVDCVNSEATADIKNVPGIIVDGAKKNQEEASDEIRSARSNLELTRPMR